MTAPLLVLGWGNPARGDDALGPLFVERVAALGLPEVECLSDFQLSPEHTLDLLGRETVLFVDASRTAAPPFECARLDPAPALGVSHALSPAALLALYQALYGSPPEAYLLGIRAECFDLGAPCSPHALLHLVTSLNWFSKRIESRPVNFLTPSELMT